MSPWDPRVSDFVIFCWEENRLSGRSREPFFAVPAYPFETRQVDEGAVSVTGPGVVGRAIAVSTVAVI